MRKLCTIIALLSLLSGLFADKYAVEIFRMGAGLRNYALGGCGVTDVTTSAPAYWNPALMLREPGMRVELMHAEEYAGELKYDVVTGALGDKMPVSITFARIGIDDNPIVDPANLPDPTQPPSSTNRPYATEWVNNADYLLWVGIAREVGGVQVGLSPKIAYRELANETAFGFGADLGAIIEPRPGWLIGLHLRDFFTTQILWSGDHDNETITPGLDLETSVPFILPVIHRTMRVYTGVETYSEGREESATTSVGPISLDYHAGLEINAHRNVDVLAGWDVEHLTAGLSFKIQGWRLHYAFEHNAELDNSHRIAAGYVF